MSKPRRKATPKQSFDVVCSQRIISRVTYRVQARSAEQARQMVEEKPYKYEVVGYDDDLHETDVLNVLPSPKLPPPRTR